MSSTAAVVSGVNYHLPKGTSQQFSSTESSDSLPTGLTDHQRTDAVVVCTQTAQNEPNCVANPTKLISSNIDSALRNSLKPWLNNVSTHEYSMASLNTSKLPQRSLNFHESSAPPLDVVIRRKIENHPNSLILCESVSKPSKLKHTLCSDSDLSSWCRCGGEHVPNHSLGLGNSGNTCYLNSVLQCLLATGPLLAYINVEHGNANSCPLSSGHLGPNKSRFCALCGVFRLLREHNQRSQKFVTRTPSFGLGHILPSYFLANVRAICPGFRPYQQEDAHEFLLGLLSRMEDGTIAGLGKISRNLSDTNPIRRIFGGVVRSEVMCHTCNTISARDEICFNLSVDITCGRSLQQCLFNYIQTEELCGKNAYKCEKCHQYRSATRRSTIFQGGPILIIQFNRFSRNQKLDTRVEFPSSFNLRPFMTESKGPPVLYKLYGTVNHEGYSCRSGHYVAFTRRHGTWLSHNDSFVNSTNVEHVLRQAPYLLFYEAVSPPGNQTAKCSELPTSQPKPVATSNKPDKLSSNTAPPKLMSVPISAKMTTPSESFPLACSAPDTSMAASVRPTGASAPRIVFNPNVKQTLGLTLGSTSATYTTTTTTTSVVSTTLPTKPNERIANSSPTIHPVKSPFSLVGKTSTNCALKPFTSTTVRQLLSGETPTPGLWSERSTPDTTNLNTVTQYQVMGSNTVHEISPRKRDHSAAASSSESFVPGVSVEHEKCVRNQDLDSSSCHGASKHSRKISESSSDSSIVWIPKNVALQKTLDVSYNYYASPHKRSNNAVSTSVDSEFSRFQKHSEFIWSDRDNRRHRHRRRHNKRRKHRGNISDGRHSHHDNKYRTHHDHDYYRHNGRYHKRPAHRHMRHSVFHRQFNHDRP